MELTDREVALVEFNRMTPRQQGEQRAAIQAVARQEALDRLTPKRRAIAEQRIVNALAAQKAEVLRVSTLTQDEREAERAVQERNRAVATIAALPAAAVAKAESRLTAAVGKVV